MREGLEALTPRQREVLRLLAAGKSRDQVAAELIMVTSTVDTHVKRIYAKLGVHKVSEAVRVYLEEAG